MVKINKQLLSQSASNVPGRTMTPKYITVHNTANTSKGANAKAHANYQSNGSGGRKASWHYQVDDGEIWQSLEDNQQGWHAGDGQGKGNTQSIGIEICENSDGDFNKAVSNAQSLIKHLMDKHNIPLRNVVPHKHWSGKNCPRKLLDAWDEFKAGINSTPKSKKDTPKSTPTSTYKGDSVVDYLKSIKQPSSFAHRKKLAAQYGINRYRGTSSQNTRLLNELRGGKPSTTTKTTSTKQRTPRTFKVGQKVKIKSSAKKYSRANVAIPSKYKNKSYTIQQVGKNDVLIKELVSWVRKSDTY